MASEPKRLTRNGCSRVRRQRTKATVIALAHAVGRADSTTADCISCGESVLHNDLQLGHILADTHNGQYDPNNLCVLCSVCNLDMADTHLLDYCTPKYLPSRWDGVLVPDPGPRVVTQSHDEPLPLVERVSLARAQHWEYPLE